VMAKNYAEGVKKVRLSVAVYDTYEDVAAVPPPPQPSDNRVTMDRPYWVSFDNTDDKHQRWETASEYCVDAPPIAASSRLVVVTTYQPDRNNVYVFEIQSAPKASAGAAASPTVAESSTSDATQAPAGATQSTSNLLETLKEQKGYLAFLTIVDCAGKNDELANGAFDVLAFSDPTVLRVMPNKKERLGLKKKPEACLAIYNAHVAKQVSNEGDTAKALSLDGKSHSASLDSSLAVIKTTNGTIYPVTEMWRP
ncbi:MAG TPA: hypothetical protein VLC93_07840, partial [Myxococcota bacterium]|nr:hypothetical protein [Myxococcota bacterium]